MYLAQIPAQDSTVPNIQTPPATFLEGLLLFVPMGVTVTYLWVKSQIEIAKEREEAELQERNKLIGALQQQNERLIDKLCENKE